VPIGGRNQIVPMTTGSSTSAERTRVTVLYLAASRKATGNWLRSPAGARRLLDAAVAAVPLLVGDDRLEQVRHAEVRPQRIGHPDLHLSRAPTAEHDRA